MTKKLSVAIGSYMKDNQQKTRWQNIGVILEKDGKEFALLDPTVDLGGVLALQNIEAAKQNKPASDRIMAGVFLEDNQGQQQQGGYQQQAPQQQYQNQQQPQQGQQQPQQNNYQNAQNPNF